MARNDLKYTITATDRSRAALRSVQKNLGLTQGAVSRLTRVMAPLAAIFSVGVLGRRLIETNKNFQQLQASLTTFTGSAERGAQAFQVLQNFASKTPFSVQEVVGSFNILIARGIKPTVAELEAFGDIASGSGKSFSQLAEAVADAAVGEFERLKEFGIKAGKESGKVTIAFGGATQTIENDSASIIKALTGIAKTGFAGATERQAKTLSGAFSNFGDAVDAAAFAIGKQGLNREINRVVREFTKFISSNKSATRAIALGLVKALRLAESAFQFVGKNLEEIGFGFALVFSASLIRRIGRVTRAIYTFTKSIVTSKVMVAAFGKLVKNPKFFLAMVGGVAAATAGIIAFSDEIMAVIDDTQVFEKLTRVVSTVQGQLARSMGFTTDEMEANAQELEVLNNAFLASLGRTKEAKIKFSALTVAVKATGVAVTDIQKKIDLYHTALQTGVIDSTPQGERVLREYELALLAANAAHEQTFASGAKLAVAEYFDGISNNAKSAKTFVTSAFQSLQTTLSNFFQTGEIDFKSFANAIKKGLADLAAKAVITTGINFLGSVFPSLKFAQGGLVPGSGGATSDNQLAALSPGEFVMRGSSVKKFGVPFMETINRGQVPGGGGGDVPEFGLGGFIKKIFKSVKKVVKKVVDTISDLVGKVTQGIRNMVQGILDGDLLSIISLASSFILPGLGTALVGSLGASSGFISAVTSGISKSFAAGILGAGSLTEIAKSVAFQLGKGALVASLSSKIVETIDDKIGSGITSSARSFTEANAARFAVLYNAASPFLEKRGNGGPVRGGRPYMVGEHGPEVFVPGRSGSISPSMNSSQIVAAVHEVRDEMSALRRQFGRALSGGELAGARA